MRLLFALLTAFVGLVLLFSGYRFARFAIPLWGFLVGLSLGGAVYSDMAGNPFLGTFLGIFIGVLAGLIFGLLAYFYYALAVVVLAGGIGYWLGSSFILMFGIHPGFLSSIAGLALGIAVGIAALLANAPKYVLVVLTAGAGAVALVGSVLLLFNTVPLSSFSYTTVLDSISNSFWWTLVALGLGGLGIVGQSRSTTGYEFEEWNWSNHGTSHTTPPTTATHVGV